jgi:hypothetical protein
MEDEPGGGQRWPAIISEGTAYGATIATHDLGFGVRTPFQFAFNRPDATHPLFQGFLGMAVGFIDRLGSFTQIMEMTQLVRHVRQDFLPFVNLNLSNFYPICTTGSRCIRLAS